jgi:hypothetical protein
MGGPIKPFKASSAVRGTEPEDDDEHKDEYEGQVLGDRPDPWEFGPIGVTGAGPFFPISDTSYDAPDSPVAPW